MARAKDEGRITIEDAQIRFRNFEGKEGRYNKEGERNFILLLEPDLAKQMYADGFNIKQLKPRDEDEAPQDYVQVKVNFKTIPGQRPPRVVMVTGRGKTTLDESTAQILDWADIAKVDLIIRPYHWDINGNTGVTAYLYSIFVTINEDELDMKYAETPDLPDSAQAVTGVRFVDEDEL